MEQGYASNDLQQLVEAQQLKVQRLELAKHRMRSVILHMSNLLQALLQSQQALSDDQEQLLSTMAEVISQNHAAQREGDPNAETMRPTPTLADLELLKGLIAGRLGSPHAREDNSNAKLDGRRKKGGSNAKKHERTPKGAPPVTDEGIGDDVATHLVWHDESSDELPEEPEEGGPAAEGTNLGEIVALPTDSDEWQELVTESL